MQQIQNNSYPDIAEGLDILAVGGGVCIPVAHAVSAPVPLETSMPVMPCKTSQHFSNRWTRYNTGMIDQIERVFRFLRSLQDDPDHAEQAREALRDFVKICDTLEDARQDLVMTMHCLNDRNEFMSNAAESKLADAANL